MRDEQHYRRMLEQNPNASVGYTLAAAMIYAARYGVCEQEHHGGEEWKSIARRLKSEYGEALTVDEVNVEMDQANRSAAAAELGRIGGSVTSERKSAANRAKASLPPKPGKRPRGRPRKTDADNSQD